MADAKTPEDRPLVDPERIRAIEEQPLEERAEALNRLHDELRAVLEAGDAAPGA